MKELSVSYESWKIAAPLLPKYYIEHGPEEARQYEVFACGSEYFFMSRAYTTAEVENFTSTYKDSSTQVDGKNDAFLRGLVSNDVMLVQKGFAVTSENELKVTDQPRSGTEKNFYMPNMTDPCCWYEESVAVVEEALVDSGDGKLWESANPNWIDLFHHRLHDEHKMDRDAYQAKIEVYNGSTWDEIPECHQAWNPVLEEYDYTLIPAGEVFIRYSLGQVVFGSSQAGKQVRASYYKATTYKCTIEPQENKRIVIVYAEIQGSSDLVFTCSVSFKIYMNIPGDGDTEVAKTMYGTMWNYLAESRGNYPIAQQMGGNYRYGETKRGMDHPSMIQPFPYLAKQVLSSAAGMRMEVVFEEGAGPWLGEHGSGTFYCLIEDE